MHPHCNHYFLFLNAESKHWSELSSLQMTTRNEAGFKLKIFRPDSETSNKWENMGLDEHMQASTLVGLVDSSNSKGAVNYLKDKANLSQVTRTLVCRTMSMAEYVDMQTIVNHSVPPATDEQETMPKATHVIIGIVYGAEAYCILTKDFNKADPNSREDAEEFLSKISSKMENALEEFQDVADFKEKLTREEKLLANRLKCRLYSDLQTQPVRECGVFEAYKYCLKLINRIKNSDGRKNPAVPVSVILFPLKDISKSPERKSLQFRDVNSELVDRCCRIWTEYEQVKAQAIAIQSTSSFINRASIRQFIKIVERFQELVKKQWKDRVLHARLNEDEDDSDVEKTVIIAETHPQFKVSRLKQ